MASLGRMTRFYRNQAVLNEFFAIGGLELGGGLMSPPPYLLDETLDFPYHPRNDDKEILFADHLTVVRTLGGWNPQHVENAGEFDLVYRDEAARTLLEGNMQNYRDLLRDSLTLKSYEGKVWAENSSHILPVSTRASSVLVFEVR